MFKYFLSLDPLIPLFNSSDANRDKIASAVSPASSFKMSL